MPHVLTLLHILFFRAVATMTSEEKKERPISMINEASNYNVTSDYAVHPMSPVGRVSYFAYWWLLINGSQDSLPLLIMNLELEL